MACNKIPFSNKKSALKEIKMQKAQRKHFNRMATDRIKNKKLKAYLCRWCGFWHLTSQKQHK